MDFKPLSKHEKGLTGHYQSYHTILTSRLSQFKRSSGQSTPSTRQTSDNTPTSSIGSARSIRIGETTFSSIGKAAALLKVEELYPKFKQKKYNHFRYHNEQ